MDHGKSEHCVPLSPYSNQVLEYERQRNLAKSFDDVSFDSRPCGSIRNKMLCDPVEQSFDLHRGSPSYMMSYLPHPTQQFDQNDFQCKRTNDCLPDGYKPPDHFFFGDKLRCSPSSYAIDNNSGLANCDSVLKNIEEAKDSIQYGFNNGPLENMQLQGSATTENGEQIRLVHIRVLTVFIHDSLQWCQG